MFKNIRNAIKRLNREQEGITGLETAIILIAFVTVASVMAYSVLTAGIFSAERGKETVYKGLKSAQSTLEIKGSVLGLTDNKTELNQVQFNIALTIPNEVVDINNIVFNYYDSDITEQGISANVTISPGSVERGVAGMIEGDEIHLVIIELPSSATVENYDAFTIQCVPPTGATITLKRTLPGTLGYVMDLN